MEFTMSNDLILVVIFCGHYQYPFNIYSTKEKAKLAAEVEIAWTGMEYRLVPISCDLEIPQQRLDYYLQTLKDKSCKKICILKGDICLGCGRTTTEIRNAGLSKEI
jgi:hypothetical protein